MKPAAICDRYSGYLWSYGPTPDWKLTETEEKLQLIPIRMSIWWIMVPVFTAVIVATAITKVWFILAIAPFAMGIIIAIFKGMEAWNIELGPWFVWDKKSQVVLLPRVHQKISISNILCLEVRTHHKLLADGFQKVSELYVFVQEHDGAINKVPLVGSTVIRSIKELANRIGTVMNVKVQEDYEH